MKLYVGTYKKYNEGSLAGAWLDLDDYADKEEFLEACYELHKDEEDPELMFQDYEKEHPWEEGLYSESCVPEKYWELKEAAENCSLDDDALEAWCSQENIKEQEDFQRAEKCYCGHYTSWNPGADYAEELYTDLGYMDNDNPLLRYVDWDAVWRDLTFENYFEESGYIFDLGRA